MGVRRELPDPGLGGGPPYRQGRTLADPAKLPPGRFARCLGVQDWAMGTTLCCVLVPPRSDRLALWLLDGGASAPPWDGAVPIAPQSDMGASLPGLSDQRVWRLVARIPPARLATYGQVAELLGAWGRARQVGWALRRLPLPSPIPWHRVVNARGSISMTPSREGSDWIQRDLLVAEGIPVDAQGRVPLARFRWDPPLPLLF